MSMDMHSVMTGKDMRNLRIKSVRGALFLPTHRVLYFPLSQKQPIPHICCYKCTCNTFIFGGLGILFHPPLKSYLQILSTFHKNVLSTYYVPNSMLGFVDLKMNETYSYPQNSRSHGVEICTIYITL